MEKYEQPLSDNAEKIAIPEALEAKVPYAEVRRVAQSIELKEFEPFEFNGQLNQLIFCEKEEESPIEFFQSTEFDGYDIYIWRSVLEKGEEFIRAILVHELAEMAINYVTPMEKISDRPAVRQYCHEIALLYENRFVSENRDADWQKRYAIFSRELRQSSKQQGAV